MGVPIVAVAGDEGSIALPGDDGGKNRDKVASALPVPLWGTMNNV